MSSPEIPFRFEYEMLDSLIAFIPSGFRPGNGQRTRVLREPAIGSVIPDVLIGIWTGELPHCEGLNTVSRHILAWLSVQKVTPSQEQLQEGLLLSRHATT